MKNSSTTNTSNVDTDLKNYNILEKIGEGGYGKVFKAEQISTGQIVAIKMLKFKNTLDEQSRKQQIARFERETQLCVQISHPNIVKLLDKGYTGDHEPYAVFEFISGETLKDLINRYNGLSAEETGALMEQVLEALICAHSEGIIHRDLKPHNIMVTKLGTKSYVKILDFGMGTFTYDFKSEDYKDLTLTHDVIGTPAYTAPEQLRGEPPTVKSDLYAWGLIFLECLTGKPVMQGTSVAEIFQKQLDPTDVPLPPSILDHPLAKVLSHVLHKDPRRRIHNAIMISEALGDVNLSTLVGRIQPQNTPVQPADNLTEINQFAWLSTHSEKRQLTVLCAKLSLSISKNATLDIETLEAIQKDQLHLCKDTGMRFGAHISGTMADTMIMYFGYPQVSDNDARRAGRTALELISQLQKRSALLYAQHRISIDIRVAMNSGTVLIKHKSDPEGLVTNAAFNLLYTTQPGHILVGETTKKLLDPYLEFEPFITQGFSGGSNSLTAFLLTGERPAEALSNLSLRSADQRMIGREQEQEHVFDVWKTVAPKNGKTILIKGQAGIGKSKLIYETKKGLVHDGFVVRECRCLPEYQNNALYPIFEMLKKDVGIHDDLTDSIPQLENALKKVKCDPAIAIPILCSWFAIPLGDTYQNSEISPLEQKEVLFNILEEWILSIDTQKKFMLIVEDLHWIDPTSLDFLSILISKISKQNYLLLLTARPEFEHDWKEEQATEIGLKILTKAYAESLIKDLIHQKEIDEKALDYIVERSDGIPLFIEDLTTMLTDQEYLILENDTYRLAAKFDATSVPVTLKGLLNTRLDRTGFAKETAQLASAIGREFTYDLLVKSSSHDEAMVQGNLNVLQEANLIYRQRRVQNEIYVFRHALIRDAAYDGMVSQLKREVHGRIAKALEDNFKEVVKENPFELARHQAEAGQYDKASQLGLEAIKRDIKNSANEEALRLYLVIKEWVVRIQDENKKLKGELDLNICVMAAISLKEGWGSHALYEMANRNVELIADLKSKENHVINKEVDEYELKNDWALFSYFHAQSKSKEAKNIGEKLIEKSIQKKNHKVEMAISSFLGQSYFVSGDIDKSEKLLTTVIEKFDLEEDKSIFEDYGFDPYIFATGMLGFVYYFRGKPNKAKKLYKDGIQYSKTTNNDTLIVLAFLFMGCFLSMLDDKKLCKEYVEELHHLLGERIHKVWVSNLFCLIEDWVSGKTDIAEEKRKSMIEAGQSLVLSFYEPSMVKTYLEVDEYEKGIIILQESIDRQTNHGEEAILPITYNLLGRCLIRKEKVISTVIENTFEKSIAYSEKMNFNLLKLMQ
ncbi:TOMM system kinase/cyclase fusion protein [Aquimarina sp. AD10]|uniref:TOMM system kinase/cyclase fusion protein n=1 Tax=Aquimarina sp. AD10 TaxID=1714849 RepID=UPI000EA9E023|nr:TOMM system kinase/cyclase fusion protein [Aquimarina sp. AD10]RKM91149.1 TOMM system kinase/cyclase fusion protein [Aquimarina sp. AD10]